jgi:asparagine synthase (glutamine-hydrolysing)
LVEWKEKALLKFNGMFAFSFWDKKEKTLLLARDRYGIKPLYYSEEGNSLCFASEQKAILAQPNFDRTINRKALLEYFTFQNIFTDQTLINGINVMPAGFYGKIDLRKKSPKLIRTQYWDFNFREPSELISHQDYTEELDRLFRKAVNRQLVSDVELGAYLSGGMDSGSITSLASQRFKDLKSFTVGFDLSSASGIELVFDERQTAEAMSAVFRTEHYEMVLKAGDMERCLPKISVAFRGAQGWAVLSEFLCIQTR